MKFNILAIATVIIALSQPAVADVIYESSFEGTDGGWVGTGDWERGVVSIATSFPGSNSPTLVAPGAAADGIEAWATNLDGPYADSGSDSVLSQTFDLTNYSDAFLSWKQWIQVFVPFDTAEVFVNGDLLYERSTTAETIVYEPIALDLTAYTGGLALVEFNLYASNVVNRAGWYIDSVSLTGTPTVVPEPATGSLLLLAGLAGLARKRRA